MGSTVGSTGTPGFRNRGSLTNPAACSGTANVPQRLGSTRKWSSIGTSTLSPLLRGMRREDSAGWTNRDPDLFFDSRRMRSWFHLLCTRHAGCPAPCRATRSSLAPLAEPSRSPLYGKARRCTRGNAARHDCPIHHGLRRVVRPRTPPDSLLLGLREAIRAEVVDISHWAADHHLCDHRLLHLARCPRLRLR